MLFQTADLSLTQAMELLRIITERSRELGIPLVVAVLDRCRMVGTRVVGTRMVGTRMTKVTPGTPTWCCTSG